MYRMPTLTLPTLPPPYPDLVGELLLVVALVEQLLLLRRARRRRRLLLAAAALGLARARLRLALGLLAQAEAARRLLLLLLLLFLHFFKTHFLCGSGLGEGVESVLMETARTFFFLPLPLGRPRPSCALARLGAGLPPSDSSAAGDCCWPYPPVPANPDPARMTFICCVYVTFRRRLPRRTGGKIGLARSNVPFGGRGP